MRDCINYNNTNDMAFQLRTQSPLKQEDPMSRFKKPNLKIQESLKKSNKTVSNAKENKKTNCQWIHDDSANSDWIAKIKHW
jgi:hypothetical protein